MLPGCGPGLASIVIRMTMNGAQTSVPRTLIEAGAPTWAGWAGQRMGQRLPASAAVGGAFIPGGIFARELQLLSATGKEPDPPQPRL